MDLKTAIEAIRREKRISKADMAKMMDMDPSNYNRLESRGEKLTIEQLQQIAQALGVTVVEIFTWGEPTSQEDKVYADLVNRINDLESYLKDKSFIIRTLESNRYNVTLWFNIVFEHFARELNIGQVQNEGITEKQKARDERKRKKGITVVYPVVFTDDDLHELMVHLHLNYLVFYRLLESLAKNNVVPEDNMFSIALKNYEQEIIRMLKS